MISEFQLLSQKIEQLASLANQLRSENAELRLQLSSLRAENAASHERIHYAYQRISALMEKLPPEPVVEEIPATVIEANVPEAQ